MWAFFQSADVALNVGWIALSATTLLAWFSFGRQRNKTEAIVALLFILVLLFPVISTADDLVQPALAYDLTPGKDGGREISNDINHYSALDATLLAALYPSDPLAHVVGEQPSFQPVARCSVFLGLASASHAPPRF